MNQQEVVVTDVSVAGTHEPFVTGVDFVAPAGEVTLVPADPGHAQVALALAIGGRVTLRTGTVAMGDPIRGSVGPADLQVRTRLVDVEDVTAPEDSLPVSAVIAEELALAERPSSRKDVAAFLEERDLADRARSRWAGLPAGLRTRLLLELAAWHPHVRVVVVAGPDRHGGDPRPWLDEAHLLARRGLTVIVLCSPTSASSLAATSDQARAAVAITTAPGNRA